MIAHAARRTIENDELLELIPHRGKMFLLSRVNEYDINTRFLRSQYDVGESCLFYDSGLGGVPAYACFEFMAQSISVLSGIAGKIMGKPPMIGFILSVTSLKITLPLFKPGDIIEITVIEEQRLDNVSVFNCTAVVDNNEAVRAKLMVMYAEDNKKYFPDEFGGKDNDG